MTQTIGAVAADPAKAAITLSHLKRALKMVAPAVASSSTVIPILQSVRMQQLSEGLAIDATNLDIAIRALIPESNGPVNALVLPTERFLSWVKLLDGKDVTLGISNSRATVRSGKIRGVFPILPAANWPQVQFKIDSDGATFCQAHLARAFKFALVAVSDDASRFTINGVFIECAGGRLQVVSTDGHRLVVYSLDSEEKVDDLLIPAGLIKSVLPLLSDGEAGIDIGFNENTILASIAADVPVFVSGKRPQGSFPKWRSLIPNDQRNAVTVDSKALLEGVERCALLADEKSGAVKLTFKTSGEILIEGSDALAGEGSESIGYTGTLTQEVTTGLAASYLIEMLKKLTGDIAILVPADGLKPFLLKASPHENESLQYLIMPMRI